MDLKKHIKPIIAVIGGTGAVGQQILSYLEDRKFPVNQLIVAGSQNSIGKEVTFQKKNIKVEQTKDIDFSKINIAFFCAGSEVSEKYANKAVDQGCIVIDKSPLYRLDPSVPLIVPEANINVLKNFQKGIISNPNCCTIPLAVVLKPLDNASKIVRTIISTYQSVSGVGKSGMDELYQQTKAKFVFQSLKSNVFPNQMAFNLFPHIGDFMENKYTEEEDKISHELRKILGNHIASTVTCVRVPVFVGHAMSVNIEFSSNINAQEVEELLSESDGIIVDNFSKNEECYTTPVDAVESDYVYVSRIRDDLSKKNCINMWICVDNLRKGASLNAVQIAETLIGD